MKICLYSPYIPKHTGGGEKYLLDVAVALAKYHQVSIGIPAQYAGDTTIVDKYEHHTNLDLSQVSFVPTPLGSQANFLQKLWWTRQFDVIYYVTDGSLFLSLAKKNILHVQLPLKIDKSSKWEQFKLSRWQVINTNSEFTKSVIESAWPVEVDVVHQPFVPVEEIKRVAGEVKREKVILHVGRFFQHLHAKRHDVLIDAFRQLNKANPQLLKGWKLVLIGSVEDEQYLSQLKRKKRGLAVEFYHDISREELLHWYGRASLYWHATGYEVDPSQHPEKVEHFGMSTAEAMAAGCVPLVHGKGGQLEVIGSDLTELLWQTIDECVQKSAALIEDASRFKKVSAQVKKRAANFSRQVFEKKLRSMVA